MSYVSDSKPLNIFTTFKKEIWRYYRTHRRSFSWREKISPYKIVVSEIMLQQTQAHRVVVKFESFIQRFPDWKSLAKAPTKDVLKEWSGLGYNRRALFLKRIAEEIIKNKKGSLPKTVEELQKLPGIGPNTAGSILAFAFNIPHPFIETNIRSVFIHFFFSEIEKVEGKRACKKIHDNEIMPLIEKTLDKENPREWYWALMDYGSFLKKNITNPSRQSIHHIKQKPFKGSNRELRSKILKLILEAKTPNHGHTVYLESRSLHSILAHFKGTYTQTHIIKNLTDLTREGFIINKKGKYSTVA